MNKTFLLLFLLLFFVFVKAQNITIDPDGCTNVREKPNGNSRILGAVYDTDILYDLSCDYDESAIIESENWKPIAVESKSHKIGYIYTPMLMSLSDLPYLYYKKTADMQIVFFDAQIQITINLDYGKNSKHLVKTNEPYPHTYKLTDGGSPFPYISNEMMEESLVITSMSYNLNGGKYNVPEEFFYDFYFSWSTIPSLENDVTYSREGASIGMRVLKGRKEIYYFCMSSGDGGEFASVNWAFDGEKLYERTITSQCDEPPVKLRSLRIKSKIF